MVEGVSRPAFTAADVELLAIAVSLLAAAATQIAAQLKLTYETEKHEREVAEEAEMRALREAFEEQRRRERETSPRR